MNFFFFFSSRRRHTRLQGDWSSDVCSSDLVVGHRPLQLALRVLHAGKGLCLAAARGRAALRGNQHARRCFRRPWRERSEEHTSELQSPCNLVCRLLLEKKKKITAVPLVLAR